ncbi:MAG: YcaO-like protein with predicted kinase domain [bacterium]
MDDYPQAIAYRIGTHRIQSPEKTLAFVKPFMEAMGITRIADVTGLDTIGIPVVMVCRPNSRSVSVSQGKGNNLAAAQASGLMESVEGYHAEHIVLPLRIASLADMESSCSMVDIAALPTVEGSLFDNHYPIAWIEAEELLHKDSRWLPYEMVHTNYTDPRPSGSGCFPASSNGLASGNNMDEATIHAICEVIERDAITLWHQLGPQGIDHTSISNDSIDSELCVETLAKLSSAGQNTFIWDITSDTKIPTYISVILDGNSHSPHIGVGSGTHLCREVALLRALHEAVQVRTTYIVGARDDITADEYTQAGIREKHDFYESIISESTFSGSYTQTLDIHKHTVDEDLITLLVNLKGVGITQVARVDLRKPEYGVAVVRVVIPGLEPPHDDIGYIPGVRALRRSKNLSQ